MKKMKKLSEAKNIIDLCELFQGLMDGDESIKFDFEQIIHDNEGKLCRHTPLILTCEIIDSNNIQEDKKNTFMKRGLKGKLRKNRIDIQSFLEFLHKQHPKNKVIKQHLDKLYCLSKQLVQAGKIKVEGVEMKGKPFLYSVSNSTQYSAILALCAYYLGNNDKLEERALSIIQQTNWDAIKPIFMKLFAKRITIEKSKIFFKTLQETKTTAYRSHTYLQEHPYRNARTSFTKSINQLYFTEDASLTKRNPTLWRDTLEETLNNLSKDEKSNLILENLSVINMFGTDKFELSQDQHTWLCQKLIKLHPNTNELLRFIFSHKKPLQYEIHLANLMKLLDYISGKHDANDNKPIAKDIFDKIRLRMLTMKLKSREVRDYRHVYDRNGSVLVRSDSDNTLNDLLKLIGYFSVDQQKKLTFSAIHWGSENSEDHKSYKDKYLTFFPNKKEALKYFLNSLNEIKENVSSKSLLSSLLSYMEDEVVEADISDEFGNLLKDVMLRPINPEQLRKVKRRLNRSEGTEYDKVLCESYKRLIRNPRLLSLLDAEAQKQIVRFYCISLTSDECKLFTNLDISEVISEYIIGCYSFNLKNPCLSYGEQLDFNFRVRTLKDSTEKIKQFMAPNIQRKVVENIIHSGQFEIILLLYKPEELVRSPEILTTILDALDKPDFSLFKPRIQKNNAHPTSIIGRATKTEAEIEKKLLNAFFATFISVQAANSQGMNFARCLFKHKRKFKISPAACMDFIMRTMPTLLWKIDIDNHNTILDMSVDGELLLLSQAYQAFCQLPGATHENANNMMSFFREIVTQEEAKLPPPILMNYKSLLKALKANDLIQDNRFDINFINLFDKIGNEDWFKMCSNQAFSFISFMRHFNLTLEQMKTLLLKDRGDGLNLFHFTMALEKDKLTLEILREFKIEDDSNIPDVKDKIHRLKQQLQVLNRESPTQNQGNQRVHDGNQGPRRAPADQARRQLRPGRAPGDQARPQLRPGHAAPPNQRAREQARQPHANFQQALRTFHLDKQNTHRSCIHTSSAHSLKKLYKRYYGIDTTIALKEKCASIFGEIKNEIAENRKKIITSTNEDNFTSQADKQLQQLSAALRHINTVEVQIGLMDNDKRIDRELISKIPYYHVIALVWQALNDSQHCMLRPEDDDEREKSVCKRNFFDFLYRNHRFLNINTNGIDNGAIDRPTCWSGQINNLVSLLDKVHSDVRIVYDQNDYFQNTIIGEVKKIILDEILSRPNPRKVYEAMMNLESNENEKNATDIRDEILATAKPKVVAYLNKYLPKSKDSPYSNMDITLKPNYVKGFLSSLESLEITEEQFVARLKRKRIDTNSSSDTDSNSPDNKRQRISDNTYASTAESLTKHSSILGKRKQDNISTSPEKGIKENQKPNETPSQKEASDPPSKRNTSQPR